MTDERLIYERVHNWEQPPPGWTHRNVGDVAVGADDRVYLLSRTPDTAVLIYESDGTFVDKWGEDVVHEYSHGIGVAPDGSVYIADRGDHAVRQFTPEGELIAVLGTPGSPSDTGIDRRLSYPYGQWTSIKRSAGPFNSPTKVSFGGNGDVYVSDGYGNARIHRFSAQHDLIHSWGEPGGGPGEFRNPHHVHVARDGRVLVADRENERIQVFSSDGDHLAIWEDVQRPAAVGTTHDGVVVVAELDWKQGQHSFTRGVLTEYVPARISLLDGDSGTCLVRFTSIVGGMSPGRFGVTSADGLAVDSKGDFYVSAVPVTFWEGWQDIPTDCPSIHKFRRVQLP